VLIIIKKSCFSGSSFCNYIYIYIYIYIFTRMAYSIRNLEGNLLTSKPQAHHILEGNPLTSKPQPHAHHNLEGNPLTSKLAPRSAHTTFNFGRGAWKMRAMTNLLLKKCYTNYYSHYIYIYAIKNYHFRSITIKF